MLFGRENAVQYGIWGWGNTVYREGRGGVRYNTQWNLEGGGKYGISKGGGGGVGHSHGEAKHVVRRGGGNTTFEGERGGENTVFWRSEEHTVFEGGREMRFLERERKCDILRGISRENTVLKRGGGSVFERAAGGIRYVQR